MGEPRIPMPNPTAPWRVNPTAPHRTTTRVSNKDMCEMTDTRGDTASDGDTDSPVGDA
jgi:hypothetical protein